jgi:hypothetical protein
MKSKKYPPSADQRRNITMTDESPNPAEAIQPLKRERKEDQLDVVPTPPDAVPEAATLVKNENSEREPGFEEPSSKRLKIEKTEDASPKHISNHSEPNGASEVKPATKSIKIENGVEAPKKHARDKVKGIALVKAE